MCLGVCLGMCVYVCVCVGVGSAVVSYDGFKIGNTHHILIKSEITGVIIIGLHARSLYSEAKHDCLHLFIASSYIRNLIYWSHYIC